MSSGFTESELKKFSQGGRVIADAIGTSVEMWARAEAGIILKAWAGRTPVATKQEVTRSAILRAYRLARRVVGAGGKGSKSATGPGQASINLGFRGEYGKVYYRTRKRGAGGGRAGFQDVYSANFGKGKRIASKDWGVVNTMVGVFKNTIGPMTKAAEKSIGLSRQSVIQIADDLGIDLGSVPGRGVSAAGVAKARRAMASDGKTYKNGLGLIGDQAKAFTITLLNRYPKAHAVKMDSILAEVISGRLKYFKTNLEKGALNSAERAARAYPYLQVLISA